MREEMKKSGSKRVIQSVAVLVMLGGVVVAAGAKAAPPTAPVATLNPGAAPVQAIAAADCATLFDLSVGEFSKTGATSTYASGGVLLDELAYGSSGNGGKLAPSAGRLTGSVPVQLPPQPGLNGQLPAGPQKTVPFELAKVNNTVQVKWTLDGTTHQASVSTCQSRIWTAASGHSAIVLHFGAPQAPPH
jgi:hypothetical protein